MKIFLTFVLCVTLASVAQGAGDANTIMWAWVGNNYESLLIADTIAYLETGTGKHIFHYTLKDDTLEIFTPYLVRGDSLVPFPSDTMSDDYFQPVDTGGFCFIIEHRDSDSLVLRPHRSSTREQFKHAREDDYLFDSTNTITLYTIFKDTLLSFNRLMFCTHSWFKGNGATLRVGSAGEIYFPPGKIIEGDMRIIIDSTKTMYLYGNKFSMQLLSLYKYGNKKALKQGYYQGCLSDSLYAQLKDLLSFSSLDRMRLYRDSRRSVEVEYSLDIYYNDKYKRTVGTNFPIISDELFMYLSFINRKVTLAKSKTAKKMFEQFNKSID